MSRRVAQARYLKQLWQDTTSKTLLGLVGLGILTTLLGCGAGLSAGRPGVISPADPVQQPTAQSLSVAPNSLTFPDTLVGAQSPEQTVTLTNTNTAITDLAFSAPSAFIAIGSQTCGATLMPGASCAFTFMFRPLRTGSQTASFTLTSAGKSISIPMSGQSSANALTFAQSAISFGDTTVGSSSQPIALIVHNAGNLTTSLATPSITGPFSVQAGSCGSTLNPTSSCNLELSFVPTSAAPAQGVLSMAFASSNISATLEGLGLADQLVIATPSGVPINDTATISGGEQQTFIALHNGKSVNNVVWSLQPGAAGTIVNGIYSAPTHTDVVIQDILTVTLASNSLVKGMSAVKIYPNTPTLTSTSPSSVVAGTKTPITVYGNNLDRLVSLSVDGIVTPYSLLSPSQMVISVSPDTTRQASYVLTGSVGLPRNETTNILKIAVSQPTVSFDAAVRFSEQAAFGPTADQIHEIQNRGFSGWIDWQLSVPSYPYSSDVGLDYGQYMRNTQISKFALRHRVTLALREIYTFGVAPACYASECGHYWEDLLEKDAFGNIRKLTEDVALSPLMGTFLNNAMNFDGWPYQFNGNQNFAREFLQLMTIGPNLLNQDGTLIYDANGIPQNSYTEQNIIDMTAALTGWVYSSSDGHVAYYLADATHPMIPQPGGHNMKKKSVLPGLTLQAGRGAPDDLGDVLDFLCKHPNMGPFLSKQLIQHLVTSNPSPEYVARISAVFNDNGNGVRGDLSAVVKAILLDVEARRSDDKGNVVSNDAHLMEPILYIANVMNLIGGIYSDDRVYISMNPMGQELLMEPNVFGYFSPSNQFADGTLAPEAELVNNNSNVSRLAFVNNILHGSLPGMAANLSTSPLWQASDSEAEIVLLDHWLFHGSMPGSVRGALHQYVSSNSNQTIHQLLPDMLFICFASSQYQVIH